MTEESGNLIVFDWNGTIIADTSACLQATNTVLDKLGVPVVSRATYQQHYTMPLAQLYHSLGVAPALLSARESEINPLWHATYNAASIRLRRGAKAMLQHLRLVSCNSIVLSNYMVKRIDEQARHLDIREYFSEIIAFEVGDATFRKRGKGARLKEYIKTNPIKKGLIIGDSEEEVEIGRELGLTTVALADGMCSIGRLRAMKPDFLIRSLNQLPDIARHIFLREELAS